MSEILLISILSFHSRNKLITFHYVLMIFPIPFSCKFFPCHKFILFVAIILMRILIIVAIEITPYSWKDSFVNHFLNGRYIFTPFRPGKGKYVIFPRRDCRTTYCIPFFHCTFMVKDSFCRIGYFLYEGRKNVTQIYYQSCNNVMAIVSSS